MVMWTVAKCDLLHSDFGVALCTVDHRGVASVDAYIVFSHRFGSSAQTSLGHAQSWIRREAYHSSKSVPPHTDNGLGQTQTFVFRLRAGSQAVCCLYDVIRWSSEIMGIWSSSEDCMQPSAYVFFT